MAEKGYVYLVGAGPGDAGLITVKGKEVLENCDVVIYDRLAAPELLSYGKSGCRHIYVGKKPGAHTMKQEEINQVLLQEAQKNQIVVRLKGGDPFVFGRGGEEILVLEKAGIPYEVIPGITSAIAVPQAAGIPVTHRGSSQSFHVITGHTADSGDTLTDNYGALAKCGGTLIFLMGLSSLAQIIGRLKEEGMPTDTPIAVVERGTTVAQRCVRGTFLNIEKLVKEQAFQSPVVIAIGAVTKLEFLNPAQKIGITGTGYFTRKLESVMEKSGTKIYRYPYVQVQKTNPVQYKELLQDIAQYTWILFTSANGVRYFFEALRDLQIDQRKIGSVKFAVIGQGTAEVLAGYGYQADFKPSSFYAKTLGREFAAMLKEQGTQKTEKILIPRAMQGSKKLTEELLASGISYVELPVYETVANKELAGQAIAAIPYLDGMTFASASGVRFLCEAMGEAELAAFAKLRIYCIGKETAAELEEFGIKKYETAESATAGGLADSVHRSFTGE